MDNFAINNNSVDKERTQNLIDSTTSSYSESIEIDQNNEETSYTFKLLSNPQNDQNANNNKISTSKYTFYNVVPLILFEQFRKLANLYFLILSVLQMIPKISPTSGVPVMLMPLTFVVIVNGLKDFFEDKKRKDSDNRENKSQTTVLNENFTFSKTFWEQLRIGEIIKVNKGEYFPADLILLYSPNKNGVAYVETKNLDGETNLKIKEPVRSKYLQISEVVNDENLLSQTFKELKKFQVKCDEPNQIMYDFNGLIESENPSTMNLNNIDDELNSSVSHLEFQNFLLRGSSLRNTDYIFGIVTYTGHETKIMLNSLSARSKVARVDVLLNKIMMIVVIIQIIISIFYSIMFISLPNPYFFLEKNHNENFVSLFVISFSAWTLNISNMVPISLIVTLEMIRFCQAMLIGWDYKIYDLDNSRGAIVQCSGLNEELGQIDYIFSDKTGTLTKNIMKFKCMIVNGKLYGNENSNESKVDFPNVNFKSDEFEKDFSNIDSDNYTNILEFLFTLALCHTVVCEKNDTEIKYVASSPDELSFVNCARFHGITFSGRDQENNIIIEFNNNVTKFRLLKIFEFNSERKKMSVIIRFPNGKIKLLCKGADSIILPLLRSDSNHIEKTWSYMDRLAEKGLRTLVFAEKEISLQEYETINKEYSQATISKNKGALHECFQRAERDLLLIGATGVEDVLQDKLSETLAQFTAANIKFWMLTGDNPNTAVSIANSCGLIDGDYDTLVLQNWNEVINSVRNQTLFIPLNEVEKKKRCIVITGEIATKIFSKKLKSVEEINIRNKLVESIISSTVVIGSRVSPKQKAEFVNLVRNNFPEKCLLSIGDGANDVNMITCADVGIGIMGNEGQQAARSADYIIGKFCYLKRLLFVHGREAYRKNCYSCLFMLWKNLVYTLPMIYYAFCSGFSGQSLYDSFLDTLYNILFTAYPIGWFAVYDKEINYDLLENSPDLYQIGIQRKCFNYFQFFRWYAYSLLTGLIIFGSAMIIFRFNPHLDSIWSDGLAIDFYIVIVVNIKLLLFSFSINVLTLILFLFSNISFIISAVLTSSFNAYTNVGVWFEFWKTSEFFVSSIFVITSCMVIEYAWTKTRLAVMSLFNKNIKVKEFINEKKKETNINKPRNTGFAFVEDVANSRIIQNQLDSNILKDSNEIFLKKQ